MRSIIFLVSIILNFVLIYIAYGYNHDKNGVFILANPYERKCLMDWKSKDPNVSYIKEHKVSGPEPFKESVILEFGGYPSNVSFEYEFSSCFSDSFTWVKSLEELDVTVEIFKSQSKSVGFYKPMDSDRILVYGDHDH